MDIYLPFVTREDTPAKRIVIDPLTRIEGHLRMEVQIKNGAVTDAWSAGTMFRGLEIILKDRDPRDAWVFAQRICGVCTTVHAIASVRAVENALGITVPNNARLVRNLLEAAQFVQDHVIHFYHLHATDWVDVVDALNADPAATSALQQSISPWHNNSADYFAGVKQRLQNLVNSGQLGLFANGYWGHPAYRLPPEGNLLATAHYLEALDWQREFIKIHAYLGGKNPHPQTYLVGGMALPVHPSNNQALTPEKIDLLKGLVDQAQAFVSQVYLPDLLLIASFYKDWANYGGGGGNFLSFGDFPSQADNNPASFYLPRGVIWNRQIDQPPVGMDQNLVKEYVTHSWYSYTGGDLAGKHPSVGETIANFTGPQAPYENLNTDGKYSWLKSPRYQDAPMEVGALARVLVAYAAGHSRASELVNLVLTDLGLAPGALFSTLGRTAARGIETQMIVEKMNPWLDELKANILAGDLQVHVNQLWEPASWPADASGWGWTEAPRGALGHWVRIQNGKIQNYQAVVPTTWNGSPRDAAGLRGPFEESLIGVPVADADRPLEVLRNIHSFDPCMACAVHLVDATGKPLTEVFTY